MTFLTSGRYTSKVGIEKYIVLSQTYRIFILVKILQISTFIKTLILGSCFWFWRDITSLSHAILV